MTNPPPLLEARNLTKRFPGVVALDDVSFDLRPGEIHALCGENGAGKSTLIKVLSGLYPAGSYEGEVHIGGEPARFHGIADAEHAGIAVIYQELALVDEMSVAENVFLGSEPTRHGLIDWTRMHREARRLLGQLNLAIDTSRPAHTLGIGQKQLVEIARALGKKSRILILDEPTAALTESEVAVLLDLLRAMRRSGMACIYISHKLEEVFSVADRITVLRDGRSIATRAIAETSVPETIRQMVGREIVDLFPSRQSAPGRPLLQVSDVCATTHETGAVELSDISFDLRAGEVLGVGGLMGSGRTELLMHLFGAWGRRTRGEVRLEGRPLNAAGPPEAIRQGVVLVTEDRKRYGLIQDQSIGRNLSLSSLSAVVRHGLIDRVREYDRNQRMFGALRIKAPTQETPVGQLSGGNQQKVVLGKALLTEPRVILLDEPTRGIDVGAKVEVYEFIDRLRNEGKAVLLVSSELPELMGLSDRIVMLCRGRIGGTFGAAEATEEALLAAAMGMHPQARPTSPGQPRALTA